jgi:hypothetical protein
MDYQKLEEELADHSVVYKPNPGKRAIDYLRNFYEVTIIDNGRQIKIRYKL